MGERDLQLCLVRWSIRESNNMQVTVNEVVNISSDQEVVNYCHL